MKNLKVVAAWIAAVMFTCGAAYAAQQKFYPVVILTPSEVQNVTNYINYMHEYIAALQYACTPSKPS